MRGATKASIMIACLATAYESSMLPYVGNIFSTLVAAVLGDTTMWSSIYHQPGSIVTVGGVATATTLQENATMCLFNEVLLE